MNSKQINFYLAPQDLAAVSDFLAELGCAIINKHSNKPEQPEIYDIKENKAAIYQVCLCRDEDINRLAFQYIEGRKEYHIDTLRSNCIEFSIGGFYPYSNKELHRSRFYFVTKYYTEDQLQEKDAAFIKWSDNIYSKFKKVFFIKNKDIASFSYATKNFIGWVNETKAVITTDGTKFIIP